MAYTKDLNQEFDDEKTSKINAAGIINITIENLWRDCYAAMAEGRLGRWNRKLDAIWAILGGDVKEDAEEEVKFNKINLALYKTGTLNHQKVGFETIQSEEKVSMSVQYLILQKKSLFLRRLQNSQGKGTAYLNDDDDDFN